MCLKFHSLPVTTHDTIKCELNGREGLEKFVVQVVYLDVVKKKTFELSVPVVDARCGADVSSQALVLSTLLCA